MNRLLLIVALLPYWAPVQSLIPPPPSLNGSYKAMGELTQFEEDFGTFQVRFEEHYDNVTKNAEFSVWEAGQTKTFLEIAKANQTYLYENDETCRVITKEEFINVKAPPSLYGYANKTGRITFSLRHLLDLDPTYIKKGGIATKYRDIPAFYWMYELKGTNDDRNTVIQILSYWSDPKWNTTSGNQRIPLGFELINITTVQGKPVQSMVQFVNVFAFLVGVVDEKAFKPREGIFCEGRKHHYKLPNFPLVNSISLRSEFLSPKIKDIRGMDAWYNTRDGLLRVDISEVDSLVTDKKPPVRYISQITSTELGVTFRMDTSGGEGWWCQVIPIDKYKFETEEIINPKLDKKQWSIHSIIGRNTTDYVFIGNTYKRNIPCKMYQGIRKDWPYQGANRTSLWEWCFSFMIESEDEDVFFRDNEVGVIYASITIIEDGLIGLPKGWRYVHNFYDVSEENAGNLSFSTYDIDRCYRPEEKQYILFRVNVDIDDDNIHIYENATSDLNFLTSWKNAIADAAKVSLKSMRVASVQSFVINKKLFVECTLLELHKDLPADAKKGQPTLQQATANVEKAINDGRLSIGYYPSAKSKEIPLPAKKGSLVKSFDKTQFVPLTTTSTESTTSTRGTLPTISLIIDGTTTSSSRASVSDDGRTNSGGSSASTQSIIGSTVSDSGSTLSSPSTPVDETVVKTVYEGHQKGTVAGVSIVMLLLGVTIGAGGAFYSFKGLPSFLRFR